MNKGPIAHPCLLAILLPLAACSGADAMAMELREDGEIAAVASAAREVQVQQGKLALSKAQVASTRGLAWALVREHSLAQTRQDELLAERGIAPQASRLSEELHADAQAALKELHETSDEAFDAVYLQAQIEAYERTLSLLEEHLIPAARNDALREQLQTSSAALTVLLQQAEELLELSDAPGGSDAVGGTSGIGNSQSGIGGPGWANSPNGPARPITISESVGGTSGVGNSQSGIGGPGWANSPNGAARPITISESVGGTSGIGNSQSGIGGPGWANSPNTGDHGPRW